MDTTTFWREYTSQDAIAKYSRTTAGTGIGYLLDHDYRAIYLEALRRLPAEVRQRGIRMLEFGCGAGMNIIYLTSTLDSEGIRVAKAVGSDFSPVLIEAAAQEAKRFLSAENQRKVQFCVAKNETLTDDVSGSLGVEKLQLKGSFDFIFGVNTFRYCHRAKKELDCAQAIFELLTPGGICVMIDMNNRFPLFRSALKDPQSAKKEECYLPTLDEYTSPFAKAGFDVLRSEHFCWVPHSAGQLMTGFLSLMTPILNLVARSRAMRSLVVAKKPESARTASASK